MFFGIVSKNNLINVLAGCFLAMFCFGVISGMTAKDAEAASRTDKIQSLRAEVVGNGHIPTGVCERMENSVKAIGVQLLEGKSLEDTIKNKAQYEGIIQQVFDKVLVGYSVYKVELRPENDLVVVVHLIPWQDKIEQLSVESRIVGMPPVVEELLREDIAGIDQLFDDMLLNLPVAAADWTNGVVKHRLNEFMLQRAPEFRADFDLVVDRDTKVIVDIYPLLPVVRTTDLSMRSDTLPNAALLTQRQNMQDGADMFVGVPVAFVERHKGTIEDLLEKRVDENGLAKAWSVHTDVTLKAAERMDIMSRSNSKDYVLRFEGRAEIGHSHDETKDNGLMVRGLLGRQFKNRDGIFTLVDFYPQHAHWDWDVGYYKELLPKITGNVRYDLKDKYWKAGVKYNFAPKWSVLYEYRHLGGINELALRYKLHDFLSLECVMDNHDRWLRFIGYF